MTVLTSDLRAAVILADEPGIVLLPNGRQARKRERSLVGHLATRAFDNLAFDVFAMSVAGVHPEYGITGYTVEEAQVQRAAIAASRRLIVTDDGAPDAQSDSANDDIRTVNIQWAQEVLRQR